ncbi:MAG: MotA/TolQ/ExbB proton channel family protein [Myxococcales bacterium]|nr:MAG: MotA/TolQ/ExbB proton channel family protein [Myxococcales bacterium]
MQQNVWQLVAEASLVVKFVMSVLMIMSVISWFIIGAKFKQFGTAGRLSRQFQKVFWGRGQRSSWDATRLESIYGQLGSFRLSPIAKIFHAGYVELARIAGDSGPKSGSIPPGSIPPVGGGLDNIDRAMSRAQNKELQQLENQLSFLATTGSTAPFIGLFGTVWGIMNSFIAIRAQGNASLDVVGGDIAEALIATALGLAAAIPAVMAYNYFLRRIQLFEGDMGGFSSDFLNIVRRHFLAS